MPFHRGATLVLSGTLAVLGGAILVQTVRLGGGIGYVVGGLFLVAGLGRLYVSIRH
jgi:hypothetical protein